MPRTDRGSVPLCIDRGERVRKALAGDHFRYMQLTVAMERGVL
jgi:hypothetical protein